MRYSLQLFLAWLAILLPSLLQAAEARVAVASNFSIPMASLLGDFEAVSGHRLKLSYASTGKLYAQIINGAPFDLLLAADARRPRLLVEQGHGMAGTQRAYALGRLALCGRAQKQDVVERLRQGRFDRLAIANPATAPYGEAAQVFLQHEGLWASLQGRLVRGENIAQTFQFVASGSVDLGLIAASQLAGGTELECQPVASGSHPPISQELVLLRRGQDNVAVLDFLDYLASAAARKIILQSGYDLP